MSTLPAHIWDSQFRMLRVAFACATLHLCTLPADDRKSFCPLPFNLFCMKSLGYGCILQTPKRQLRRFCLSYLLDLNFTCASKQYVRFLIIAYVVFSLKKYLFSQSWRILWTCASPATVDHLLCRVTWTDPILPELIETATPSCHCMARLCCQLSPKN